MHQVDITVPRGTVTLEAPHLPVSEENMFTWKLSAIAMEMCARPKTLNESGHTWNLHVPILVHDAYVMVAKQRIVL